MDNYALAEKVIAALDHLEDVPAHHSKTRAVSVLHDVLSDLGELENYLNRDN